MPMVRLLCVALATCIVTADEDVGFLDWFSTEKAEVWEQQVDVNGSIPSYVNGVFAQSGPAQFEMGKMHFGHALDGFAKTIRFEIDASANASSALFTTSFLQSGFYKDSMKKGTIAASMTAAETIPPSRAKLGSLNGMGANDNNYIKPQKVGKQFVMTSDTMYLTLMNGTYSNITETITAMKMPFSREPSWEDKLQPFGHLCIQANMAHGAKEPDGSYMAAMGCQTANIGLPDFYIIFKIHDSDIRKRELVAKIPTLNHRRPSYMHQNGVTESNYVIIGTPLYMDMINVLRGKGLAQGGLDNVQGDVTAFHVVNRRDGTSRTATTPGFLMGHVINTWEEGDDVLLDITVYKQRSGGFFARYLLDIIQNKSARDNFDKGTVMRYRIKTDNTVQTSLAVPDPEMDVELPVINPNYKGKKACFFWAVQFGTGRRSFASIAVVKQNVCLNETTTLYEEGVYPSEHRFIPRPGATEEDDGVLVGLTFNGSTKLSTLQVLDAKNLQRLATIPTGIKVPFPIHTTWFGKDSEYAALV